MRGKAFLTVMVLVLFIVFSCVPSWAQYPSSRDSKRISDIKIKGNYSVSTITILNKLKMKTGDVFEESALNKELRRLYATGFFSDVFVETEDRPEGVVVIFTVVEKPIVSKIEFQGNTKARTGRLMKKISVKEGDILDFSVLSRDVAAIRNYYIEEGYSNVRVDYRIDTDRDTGRSTLVFEINEGVPLKIRSIAIEGNKHIPNAEILKYMSTKTAWWFIRKGAYDPEKLQADLDRIRSLYRSKGFLDARVTSKTDLGKEDNDILLTVIIEEGNQYQIGDITINGQLAFPEHQIRAMIKSRPGDPFDYQRIKEDMEDVRAFYYDRGYMNAEINLERKYDHATGRMNLIYDITAHEEVYVGKVNILGNTKTRDKVIRRELRVYPGDKYNGEKLKVSKERIYNLGFFEDVYFETIPTGQKNVKDLHVTVKETKTGEFSFGGGYSSIDAFLGFVQVNQKNFDILNFPTFTGGGQNLTIRGEMGSARTNYLLSWTDPWIFDYPYLFGFDVYRQEHKRYGKTGYGYDETRTGGALRFGKEITDQLSTGLIYNLEEVDIGNIPDNATNDLKKEEGKNWISRVTWNLGYDSRDNKYSPTHGWVGNISLENAGGFIGGDKDFVKGFLDVTFYHGFWEDNIVLSLRGRLGLGDSYGDSNEIPIYERFFTGGATTLRGYKQRGVGPRDLGTNTALGGEAVVVGNAEVTFPIWKGLIKGAVFYDVGNLWGKIEDAFTTTDYKNDVGIGVRVKTPIGPVKLDYGYPLNDNHDDKKEGQFWFSVSHGF